MSTRGPDGRVRGTGRNTSDAESQNALYLARNQAAADAGLGQNFYGEMGMGNVGDQDVERFAKKGFVTYNGKEHALSPAEPSILNSRNIPYVTGPGGQLLVDTSNPNYKILAEEIRQQQAQDARESQMYFALAAGGMFAGPVAASMGAGAGAASGGFEGAGFADTAMELAPGVTQNVGSSTLATGAVDPMAWTGADAGNPGALGSAADTSGLGYGPTGSMTAEQWLATPGAVPGSTPTPTGAPTGSSITPQAVQQMIQSGMGVADILKAIQSGIGVASGLNTVLNPTTAVDPNMIDAMWRAGQQTYQTSLDPQGDLYKRNQQILQEQVRASQAARGTSMSPFGAGIEDKAMSDFLLDWNNQQLQRQVAGTQAFTGAGSTAAQAGVANNAQAFMQNQVGVNNLTTGVGTIGDWLTNLWGAGKTANPVAGSTPTGGFDMGYFGAQPGTYSVGSPGALV